MTSLLETSCPILDTSSDAGKEFAEHLHRAHVKRHRRALMGYVWLSICGAIIFAFLGHQISDNQQQLQEIRHAREGACDIVEVAFTDVAITAEAGIRQVQPLGTPESYGTPALYESAKFQTAQTVERNARLQEAADSARAAAEQLESSEYCNP